MSFIIASWIVFLNEFHSQRMPEKNTPFMRGPRASRQLASERMSERFADGFARFASVLAMFTIPARSPANHAQPVPPRETSLGTEMHVAATPPPVASITAHWTPPTVQATEMTSDPRLLEQQYLLRSSLPEVRQEIIRALGEIKSRESVEVLSRLFQRERREELKIDILGTIGDLDDDKMLEPKLAFLFRAVTPMHARLVREVAISTLADIDDRRVIALLESLQSDGDLEIRNFAAEILRDGAR